MRKVLIPAILMSISAHAESTPDCTNTEDFRTSTHAMLVSELLPVDLQSPEADARIRFSNGDYRLLAYGDFSGVVVPGEDILEPNQICELGIRVFPGATDSYESADHRELVEDLKAYVKAYNLTIIDLLENADQEAK